MRIGHVTFLIGVGCVIFVPRTTRPSVSDHIVRSQQRTSFSVSSCLLLLSLYSIHLSELFRNSPERIVNLGRMWLLGRTNKFERGRRHRKVRMLNWSNQKAIFQCP